jgi:hypothetical protein
MLAALTEKNACEDSGKRDDADNPIIRLQTRAKLRPVRQSLVRMRYTIKWGIASRRRAAIQDGLRSTPDRGTAVADGVSSYPGRTDPHAGRIRVLPPNDQSALPVRSQRAVCYV